MLIKNCCIINPKSLKKYDYINYIDTSSLQDGRLLNVQYLQDNFPSRAQRQVEINDILISSVRPNLLHNGMIKSTIKNCIASTGFIHIRCNNDVVVPRYIYYLLTSNKNINTYIKIADSSQTTFPTFNKNVIENMQVIHKDLSTQQHIVDTIGSVDDLIEKNEEIMQKFNTYLQSQYKSIICTCKEKINLGSFVERMSTPADINEWTNEQVIDLSSMPQDNICITTSSNGSDFTTNIKKLEEDTLLYGSIRPYFHKCGFTTGIKYVAGTVHSFKVINEKLTTYILAVISSNEFHDYTNTNSQGTKMPIINWDTFTKYEVNNLNEKDIEYFYNNTYSIYKYIKILIKQNKKLLKIKNQLLDKYFN